MAKMDTVVLYHQHELLHDHQGGIPMGQGLRQGYIRQLVQVGLLLGL